MSPCEGRLLLAVGVSLGALNLLWMWGEIRRLHLLKRHK